MCYAWPYLNSDRCLLSLLAKVMVLLVLVGGNLILELLKKESAYA